MPSWNSLSLLLSVSETCQQTPLPRETVYDYEGGCHRSCVASASRCSDDSVKLWCLLDRVLGPVAHDRWCTVEGDSNSSLDSTSASRSLRRLIRHPSLPWHRITSTHQPFSAVCRNAIVCTPSRITARGRCWRPPRYGRLPIKL